jgi:hypothetical protein
MASLNFLRFVNFRKALETNGECKLCKLHQLPEGVNFLRCTIAALSRRRPDA